MSRKLTKYKKLRKSGYRRWEAAVKAGITGGQLMKQEVEERALEKALVRQGLTYELMARRIVEGLGATKVDKVGESVDEVPDHMVRHKFLETALKLKGERGYVSRGNTESGGGVSITIVRQSGEETLVRGGKAQDVIDVKALNDAPDTEVEDADDGLHPSREAISKQM